MDMRFIRAVLLLLLLIGPTPAILAQEGGGEKTPLKLPVFAAEVWTGYTEADGVGFYWDLLNDVFNRQGVFYKRLVSSLDDGLGKLSIGDVNGVVGVYVTPKRYETLTFPKVRLDNEITSIFFKKGTTYTDVESLTGQKVGVRQEYDYPEDFTAKMDLVLYDTTETLVTQLIKGDVNFIMGSKYDLQDELTKQKQDIKEYEIKDVLYTPIYMVFQKNIEGQQLADIFDTGMKKLYKAGLLKEFFQQRDSIESFYFPELVEPQ